MNLKPETWPTTDNLCWITPLTLSSFYLLLTNKFSLSHFIFFLTSLPPHTAYNHLERWQAVWTWNPNRAERERERARERERKVDLGCLLTPGLSKDIRCHVWPYYSKQYGAQRERERERGIKRLVDFRCLLTPGLSKDIQCHVWPYFCKQHGAGRKREGERDRGGWI